MSDAEEKYQRECASTVASKVCDDDGEEGREER